MASTGRAKQRAERQAAAKAPRPSAFEPAAEEFGIDPAPVVEEPLEELPKFNPEPVPEGPLAALGNVINARLELANRNETTAQKHRLAAAIELKKAKEECARLHLPFLRWAEATILQSKRTVQELLKVAYSPDPEAALADLRARNAARNRQHRETRRLAHTVPTPPPPALAAPEPAQAEPAPEPQEVARELMDDLGLLDVPARRELADKATFGLPPDAIRAHVEKAAEVLGLRVDRKDNGANYFPTVTSVVADFIKLSRWDRTDALARMTAFASDHKEEAA